MLKEGAGGFLLMVENLHKDTVIQYQWFFVIREKSISYYLLMIFGYNFHHTQKTQAVYFFIDFWTLDNFIKLSHKSANYGIKNTKKK